MGIQGCPALLHQVRRQPEPRICKNRYENVVMYYFSISKKPQDMFILMYCAIHLMLSVFHGYGGRLTVSDTECTPVTRLMTMAFKEHGVNKRDVNGRSQYG